MKRTINITAVAVPLLLISIVILNIENWSENQTGWTVALASILIGASCPYFTEIKWSKKITRSIILILVVTIRAYIAWHSLLVAILALEFIFGWIIGVFTSYLILSIIARARE